MHLQGPSLGDCWMIRVRYCPGVEDTQPTLSLVETQQNKKWNSKGLKQEP